MTYRTNAFVPPSRFLPMQPDGWGWLVGCLVYAFVVGVCQTSTIDQESAAANTNQASTQALNGKLANMVGGTDVSRTSSSTN